MKTVYELTTKEMVDELKTIDAKFIQDYLVTQTAFEWQDVKSPVQQVALNNMIRDLIKLNRVFKGK